MTTFQKAVLAHHDYVLEEKGVEADPRRVEQLVNPDACAAFLRQGQP